MMLAPIWRTRFFAIGGSLFAVLIGIAIAEQALFWPLLCLAGIALMLLIQLQGFPINTLLLGMLILGYIVGNRGFAELYVNAGLIPLLPAEMVLLIAVPILCVKSAFRRELPFHRDPLNVMLLLWIAIGSVRLVFDLRVYGFVAIRDFVTVYYAAFFFLGQACAREPAGKRFLVGCLIVGCTLLLPGYLLFVYYPDFFLSVLTFRGSPLIFYKGDLAGTFLAVGALLYFVWFESRPRWWWCLIVSLVFVAGTFASNNRASMLGLAVATLFLAFCGRWKFAAVQFAAGTFAAFVIVLVANLTGGSWQKTPLYGLYEQTISLSDPQGQRTYTNENSFNKGDDNLFRTVWWHDVYDETIQTNPWLGLGFGYDLADRFAREYYPEGSDEFSARSPHNVVLTIFARMGLAGLLPFLAIVGLMALRTIRAIRAGQKDDIMLWCSAWIIFTSACFGVVLEGPMGAVVFWTLLGLANATNSQVVEAADPATATEPATPVAAPAITAGQR
jgi:O-antigen ligase